jgi:hypothetical protein
MAGEAPLVEPDSGGDIDSNGLHFDDDETLDFADEHGYGPHSACSFDLHLYQNAFTSTSLAVHISVLFLDNPFVYQL